MDALKVGTLKSMLETGRTSSQIEQTRLNSEFATPNGIPNENSGKSFGEVLTDTIASVNQLQHKADHMMEKLATGEEQNIAEVMVTVEKADIAMKLMMQVRNKIIDAYQEVMKMQV